MLDKNTWRGRLLLPTHKRTRLTRRRCLQGCKMLQATEQPKPGFELLIAHVSAS